MLTKLQELVPAVYTLWFNYGPYLVIILIGRLIYSVLCRQWRTTVKHEVVLITGASSGIGECLAKLLYMKGAKVILAARRASELERVKMEMLNLKVSGLPPPQPKILAMDMSDLDSIENKVEEALKFYGRIDVVVNSAGILSRAEVIDSDMRVYKDVMQVNYFGVVRLTCAVLPFMLERNRGHIVTLSSVQGRMSIPRRSAYAASKHAIVAFMDSLRAEIHDQGIKVTCVHPGYVKTNIAQASLTAAGEQYGKSDPNIESGYKVDYVAKKICDAVETQRPDVVVAPLIPRLLIFLRTVWPSLYFFIMKRIAKSHKYY